MKVNKTKTNFGTIKDSTVKMSLDPELTAKYDRRVVDYAEQLKGQHEAGNTNPEPRFTDSFYLEYAKKCFDMRFDSQFDSTTIGINDVPDPDYAGYSYEEIIQMANNGVNIPTEVLIWAKAQQDADITDYIVISSDIEMDDNSDTKEVAGESEISKLRRQAKEFIAKSNKAQKIVDSNNEDVTVLTEKAETIAKQQKSAFKSHNLDKTEEMMQEWKTLDEKNQNGELNGFEKVKYKALSKQLGAINGILDEIDTNNNELKDFLSAIDELQKESREAQYIAQETLDAASNLSKLDAKFGEIRKSHKVVTPAGDNNGLLSENLAGITDENITIVAEKVGKDLRDTTDLIIKDLDSDVKQDLIAFANDYTAKAQHLINFKQENIDNEEKNQKEEELIQDKTKAKGGEAVIGIADQMNAMFAAGKLMPPVNPDSAFGFLLPFMGMPQVAIMATVATAASTAITLDKATKLSNERLTLGKNIKKAEKKDKKLDEERKETVGKFEGNKEKLTQNAVKAEELKEKQEEKIEQKEGEQITTDNSEPVITPEAAEDTDSQAQSIEETQEPDPETEAENESLEAEKTELEGQNEELVAKIKKPLQESDSLRTKNDKSIGKINAQGLILQKDIISNGLLSANTVETGLTNMELGVYNGTLAANLMATGVAMMANIWNPTIVAMGEYFCSVATKWLGISGAELTTGPIAEAGGILGLEGTAVAQLEFTTATVLAKDSKIATKESKELVNEVSQEMGGIETESEGEDEKTEEGGNEENSVGEDVSQGLAETENSISEVASTPEVAAGITEAENIVSGPVVENENSVATVSTGAENAVSTPEVSPQETPSESAQSTPAQSTEETEEPTTSETTEPEAPAEEEPAAPTQETPVEGNAEEPQEEQEEGETSAKSKGMQTDALGFAMTEKAMPQTAIAASVSTMAEIPQVLLESTVLNTQSVVLTEFGKKSEESDENLEQTTDANVGEFSDNTDKLDENNEKLSAIKKAPVKTNDIEAEESSIEAENEQLEGDNDKLTDEVEKPLNESTKIVLDSKKNVSKVQANKATVEESAENLGDMSDETTDIGAENIEYGVHNAANSVVVGSAGMALLSNPFTAAFGLFLVSTAAAWAGVSAAEIAAGTGAIATGIAGEAGEEISHTETNITSSIIKETTSDNKDSEQLITDTAKEMGGMDVDAGIGTEETTDENETASTDETSATETTDTTEPETSQPVVENSLSQEEVVVLEQPQQAAEAPKPVVEDSLSQEEVVVQEPLQEDNFANEVPKPQPKKAPAKQEVTSSEVKAPIKVTEQSNSDEVIDVVQATEEIAPQPENNEQPTPAPAPTQNTPAQPALAANQPAFAVDSDNNTSTVAEVNSVTPENNNSVKEVQTAQAAQSIQTSNAKTSSPVISSDNEETVVSGSSQTDNAGAVTPTDAGDNNGNSQGGDEEPSGNETPTTEGSEGTESTEQGAEQAENKGSSDPTADMFGFLLPEIAQPQNALKDSAETLAFLPIVLAMTTALNTESLVLNKKVQKSEEKNALLQESANKNIGVFTANNGIVQQNNEKLAEIYSKDLITEDDLTAADDIQAENEQLEVENTALQQEVAKPLAESSKALIDSKQSVSKVDGNKKESISYTDKLEQMSFDTMETGIANLAFGAQNMAIAIGLNAAGVAMLSNIFTIPMGLFLIDVSMLWLGISASELVAGGIATGSATAGIAGAETSKVTTGIVNALTKSTTSTNKGSQQLITQTAQDMGGMQVEDGVTEEATSDEENTTPEAENDEQNDKPEPPTDNNGNPSPVIEDNNSIAVAGAPVAATNVGTEVHNNEQNRSVAASASVNAASFVDSDDKSEKRLSRFNSNSIIESKKKAQKVNASSKSSKERKEKR